MAGNSIVEHSARSINGPLLRSLKCFKILVQWLSAEPSWSGVSKFTGMLSG